MDSNRSSSLGTPRKKALTMRALFCSCVLSIACLFILTGCPAGNGRQAAATPQVAALATYRTDIAGLDELITLPAPPVEVRWQIAPKGVSGSAIGPTDYDLVAVLTFDAATLQGLQSQWTEQDSPPELLIAKEFMQPWFAPVLEPLVTVDPAFPAFLRLTGTRYEPMPFAKNSLRDGYVLVRDNQVFIYLFTT